MKFFSKKPKQHIETQVKEIRIHNLCFICMGWAHIMCMQIDWESVIREEIKMSMLSFKLNIFWNIKMGHFYCWHDLLPCHQSHTCKPRYTKKFGVRIRTWAGKNIARRQLYTFSKSKAHSSVSSWSFLVSLIFHMSWQISANKNNQIINFFTFFMNTVLLTLIIPLLICSPSVKTMLSLKWRQVSDAVMKAGFRCGLL